MFAVEADRLAKAIEADSGVKPQPSPGLMAKIFGKKVTAQREIGAVETILDEMFESDGPQADDLDKAWDVISACLEMIGSAKGIKALNEAVLGQNSHQGGPMEGFGFNKPQRVAELSSALALISPEQMAEYLPKVPKDTYLAQVIEDDGGDYFTENFERLRVFYKRAAASKQSVLMVPC